MNLITLGGSLGEKFGGPYLMDVANVREGVHGLCLQIPGLERAILDGQFRVSQVRNDIEIPLDEETIDLGMYRGEFRITPAVTGSGGGVGKVLLGIVLIGAAILTAGAAAPLEGLTLGAALTGTTFLGVSLSTFALFGAALALGGIAMLIAPAPQSSGAAANNNSTSFGQIENTALQGVPVPLVYGHCLAGSVVISADITSDQVYVTSGAHYDSGATWTGIFGSYPGSAVHLA